MKVDLHLHTVGSQNVFDNKWARLMGARDCYSDPEKVYRIAKQNGMDLVAITDHNEISEAVKLAEKHNDAIVGSEYMVKASDKGHILDVVVLDLDTKIHKEFMKLRKESLEKFTTLARQEKKPYFLCHIGFLVNPNTELIPSMIDEWVSHFDIIETINGSRQRENEFAQLVAELNGKGCVGGSDSHSEMGVGLTWTEANANSKDEFFKCLIKGEIEAHGEWGSYKKLKKDALLISKRFFKYEANKVKEKGFKQALKDLNSEDYKRVGVGVALAPFLLVIPDLEVRYHQKHQERLMLKAEKQYLDYKLEQLGKGNPLVALLKKWWNLEKIESSAKKIKPKDYYIKETRFEKIMDKVLGYELTDED